LSSLVHNPNIGLRPARRRGAHNGPAGFRLPVSGAVRDQRGRRRRRARLGLAQPARLRLPARPQLGAFARVYVYVALVALGLILYLFQAAGATQASYEIGRLQGQQQDLLAQQNHLRYEEATLQSPAQVETAAAQTGMVRPVPARYLDSQPVDLGLGSPPPEPPDQAPRWERDLAAVTRQIGAQRDALAAGR
jgi:cell division protein FtsL